MKTGFIGLGAMGQGMAANLAKAGLLAAVYNRTTSRAEAFAQTWKVTACQSIEELAGKVDVALLCVSADSDVLDVVAILRESLTPGSVVIDMSTVGSDTARTAAQMLADRAIDFLDAPVSGGVEGARLGTLSVMVGGDAATLLRIRTVLEAMSARIEHLGTTGAGQACKAVNQIMAAGINQAVTEALAFAEAQGLDMNKVIDVVSAGAAGNWFLQHRGKSMSRGMFEPGFRLKLHHKDLLIARQMANKVAAKCPLTTATLQDYALLIEQGFGDEDISALYRLKHQND